MMKSRIIWIIIGGLCLAVALIVTLQVLDVLARLDGSAEERPSVVSEQPTAPLGVTPTLFSDIIEFEEAGITKLRLTGTAEPNSVVIILENGENTRQIRSNDNGDWSVTLATDDSRPTALEAVLFNETGVTIRGDETIYRIVMPLELDDAPAETTSFEDFPESAEAPDGEEVLIKEIQAPAPPTLIMVSAPGGPTRIVKSPFGGSPTNGPLTMGPIDYDDAGGVIFSGMTSEPGIVRLYANQALIGETRVGAEGRWNFIAGKMLPRGEYDVRAELVRPDQDPIDVTVPFELLRPTQLQSTNQPIVVFEPFRWQVRRELLGGGFQSTVIFAPIEADPLIAEDE